MKWRHGNQASADTCKATVGGLLMLAGTLCSALPHSAFGHPAAPDTPVELIADHIRRQGFACDTPRRVKHDVKASKPRAAVWNLYCGNAAYRVIFTPDMTARVEHTWVGYP